MLLVRWHGVCRNEGAVGVSDHRSPIGLFGPSRAFNSIATAWSIPFFFYHSSYDPFRHLFIRASALIRRIERLSRRVMTFHLWAMVVLLFPALCVQLYMLLFFRGREKPMLAVLNHEEGSGGQEGPPCLVVRGKRRLYGCARLRQNRDGKNCICLRGCEKIARTWGLRERCAWLGFAFTVHGSRCSGTGSYTLGSLIARSFEEGAHDRLLRCILG